MDFWKMNGAGNDFILIDNRNDEIPEEKLPELAKIVCERHMSVGADGMMVIANSNKADFKMLFFNSDGSMGEMCGNGARCICRYGYEMGVSNNPQTIETTAGIVSGQRISESLYRIRLNDPSVIKLNDPIEIDGKTYDAAYVELGNPGIPHALVPIQNLKEYPEQELFELGKKIRYYHGYPKGANVNFYEIIDKDHVYERTWERGVEGFTYACGTGTGSLATVLTLKEFVSGKQIRVDMHGGTLFVDVETENQQVKNLYLTGPTNIVAKGQLVDAAVQELLR